MVEIHTGSAPAFIRYDPERTDFTVTEGELERIGSASYNLWKDLFLVCLSIAVPCILNAVSNIPKPFTLDLELFINFFFGGITAVFSIAFGLAWRQTRIEIKPLLAEIKNKPKFKVELSQTGSGGGPAVILRHENGSS